MLLLFIVKNKTKDSRITYKDDLSKAFIFNGKQQKWVENECRRNKNKQKDLNRT